MSFYGNSYHYTAESFARVVLQNSGIKNYLTCPDESDIFKLVPETEKIYLDARQRESGLGIQSGNHWITLAQSGDTFQIWHSEPGAGSDERFIVPVSTDDNPPIGAITNENTLDFGDTLKIATIFYDPAGHISTPGPAQYYQMPPNPVKPLEIRMNKIDGLNAAGEEDEPLGGSLKTQLIDTMNTTLETIQGIETSINDTAEALSAGLAELSITTEKANTADANAQKASSDVSVLYSSVVGILQRLEELEAKI